MRWLNDYRMKLVLVGFVAAFMLGGGSAKADFTFGEPTNLGPPVNSSASEASLCISADGLELYFESERPGGYGASDLLVMTRQSKNDDWDPPVNLGPGINTSTYDWSPSLSADGLSLYFCSGGHGGYGSNDVYVTTRASRTASWGEPVNLGPLINTSANDGTATISSDGLELYYYSDRPGKHGVRDIWVAKRTTVSEPWGEPVNLGPIVNRSTYNICPSISSDGLRLFYCSGSGNMELWVAKRSSKNASWEESTNLGLDYGGTFPYISRDGLTLYFSDYAAGSRPPGGLGGDDLWWITIIPTVDLNGDGIVDSDDLCIMVDHWGEGDSLCDIGPMPWGDGVVDVEDLKVLAEHLFEEIFSPELVAYWKLDEVEGDVAYNSVSDDHGTLSGNPTWQPDDGMVAGALQFDGIDDHIITDFVLDPSLGAFSVFAWIQGGAPGQVVISQQSMANWLAMDADGNLMTDLKCTGRSAGPLYSETVITDGQWHRIGLIWDGSYRHLYVDGIEVATDYARLSSLVSFDSGLYLGTGSSRDPQTYFSGLIDDVRIYDVALSTEQIEALAQ